MLFYNSIKLVRLNTQNWISLLQRGARGSCHYAGILLRKSPLQQTLAGNLACASPREYLQNWSNCSGLWYLSWGAGLEPALSIPGNSLLPLLQGKCQVAKMCQVWILPHCYHTVCMCWTVKAQLLQWVSPGCKGSTVLGNFLSQKQTSCTFLETCTVYAPQ